MMLVVLPDPFRGVGCGGIPRRPNSQAMPQRLDQRSKMDRRSRAKGDALEILSCTQNTSC